MDENPQTEPRATQLRAGRVILAAAALAAGSLAVLGGVLYAALWLPYAKPEESLPRSVEILPLEVAPPTVAPEVINLDTYGWVDREAGVARIPLREAMELAVQTLPVRAGADQAAARRAAAKIPTDAGSGRFVEPNVGHSLRE